MPRNRSKVLRTARGELARALYALDLAEAPTEEITQRVVITARRLLALTLTDSDRKELRGFVEAHQADGKGTAPDHWRTGHLFAER